MKKYEFGHTPSSLSFDSSVSFWNSSSSSADKHSSSRLFCGERSETRESIMSQSGRSIVEILGVIAVIGVLTLGGIIGFKYAMDKYKANEIVHEAGLRASDIFHRYQTIPFPAVGTFGGYENCTNDFEEWTPETKVGYTMNTCAIKDEDGTDLAFAIAVKDVPMGVCQRLTEMEPHKYMEGFRYMIVGGDRYVRNQSNICHEDVQDVIFVMLLDGEFEECTGDDCAEACVFDDDCAAICDCAICDEDTRTCMLPFTEAGEPQVCNEGRCEPTEQCLKGIGFRTKGGVCVPCTDDSDYALDPTNEIFRIEREDGSIAVEDLDTPADLCTGCGAERKWMDNAAGDRRCFIDCPLGFGYTPYRGLDGEQYDSAEYEKGCISCDATDDFAIPNADTLTAEACKACGNYVYDRPTWSSKLVKFCGVPCDNREFKGTLHAHGGGQYGGKCYSCDTTDTPIIVPNGTSATGTINHEQQCADCGRIVMKTSGESFCVKTDICGENEFMTAPYLNNNIFKKATCQSCSSTTSHMIFRNSVDGVSGWETFVNSCKACGNRTVIQDEQGDWWCIPMGQTCAADEFLDSSGICHKCSDTSAIVVSDEHSSCTTVCDGTSVDTDGDGINDTVKRKRRIVSDKWGSQRCMVECKAGQIQDLYGECYDCDTDASFNVGEYQQLQDECTSCTKTVDNGDGTTSEVSSRYVTYYHNQCTKKSVCPEGQFLAATGVCTSCATEKGVMVFKADAEMCNACPYVSETKQGRTYCGDSGPSCYLINPGVSGTCNSYGDFQGNNPYPAGDGKLLRDTNTGRCVPCNSPEDVNLYTNKYPEQCASCGEGVRVLNGAVCSLNRACSEGVSFWNQELGRCMLCTKATGKRYKTTYEKKGLCAGCGLRFMEVEETTDDETIRTYYCAKQCAAGQWQDALGNCIDCAKDGADGNYIGADSVSRDLCTACDRTVRQDALNDWVCEK